VQVDGLAVLEALRKVVAHEELLHGEIARQADDVGEIERRQPLVVVAHPRQVGVEDFEGLLGVGAGVLHHLIAGELLAHLVLVRRVADEAGERADQERDVVAEFLKLAQLAHGDGVAEVQIRRARVVAAVNAQRPASAAGLDEPGAQLVAHVRFGFRVAVFGPRHENINLFVNRGSRHGCVNLSPRREARSV
jgi:hypothetical protein